MFGLFSGLASIFLVDVECHSAGQALVETDASHMPLDVTAAIVHPRCKLLTSTKTVTPNETISQQFLLSR